jgi:excisionase family DNA binding protein
MDRKAYSPTEAAIIAGTSRTVIFAEIKANRLDAKKLGRRTLITDSALNAWLAGLPSARKPNSAIDR